MNLVQSLDQKYLDFCTKTDAVFARYPEIETLRYFIFKELLVRRNVMGCKGFVKHWLRPFLRRSHSAGPMSRSDLLIWIEGSREVIVDALLPVYFELESRGIKVQLVSSGGPNHLPPTTTHFQFPARAVPPLWAKEAWEALCDSVEGLRDRPLGRSFYYACANIQSLCDELDRILNAIQPKVVLNASTQLVGGAGLIVVSRLHGAQTFLLQHGMLQPFYTPLLPDYMLTWGESSNETLVRLGVSRQRLMALGSPRHDSMGSLAQAGAKSALLSTLSLPNRPTFVFFSNGNDLVRNGKAPLECARWLETTAAQYSSDMNMIVRLHPNEDGSLYRTCPHLFVTKESVDLELTLDGCDWVGSLCSTTLYDALLYKKPIWQFYADDWPELADNWKYGLAVRISSQQELGEQVNCMLRHTVTTPHDESLPAHVFSNHGRATQAIADFVQQRLEV